MNKYRQLELPRKTNHKKEEYKYFVGTTLKNSLDYEIGEKIVFKIRPKFMDDYIRIPFVFYTLITDDGKTKEEYIQSGEDGWFYIEASISKSGFVYVNAKACDTDKNVIEEINPYNGSAGADVENILRAVKIPENYTEFWDKLKAEVERTQPELLLCEKKEDENHPEFEIYDMHIKVPGSDYVSVMVSYPKGSLKNSLKFAMFFQGYGVGPACPNTIDGYFTVMVNAHCMPNNETEEFYANIREKELKGYGFDAVENQRPETTYWAKMFLRNLQALRYFKDHELINKTDYYFIGSSQGGMQAMNMAAHFDKATGVILNVPWMADTSADLIVGRRPNTMPKGDGIAYFDTAVAAEYLNCPAYIISGLGDGTCNSSTQMALFNAVKSQKYIEFYQNKVHSFTIPWDNYMYSLGDASLKDKYKEFTQAYYDWN